MEISDAAGIAFGVSVWLVVAWAAGAIVAEKGYSRWTFMVLALVGGCLVVVVTWFLPRRPQVSR